MAKNGIISGIFAGCLLAVGASRASAQPSPREILDIRPKHPDAVYSITSPDELMGCKVELVTGTRKGSTGWLLVDSKRQPIRRFFDSNGDKKIDLYSYYKDGVEVYREIDSNFNEKVDQFRWLGTAGMKWGIDRDEDGRIDSWKMISAEEAAHEVFLAVAARDYNRLRTLFINDQEIAALKLPAAQVTRIHELQKQAEAKFQKLAKQIDLRAAHFVRVEGSVPQCLSADTLGSEQDLIKHAARAILYETADKKHDWLHSGEMLQVGYAWRLIDSPGMQDVKDAVEQDPELQGLLNKLAGIDSKAPSHTAMPAAIRDYNLLRVQVIEQVLARVKAEEKETWVRQLLDNLQNAAVAEYPDTKALKRLTTYKDQILQSAPGSAIAAYALYRELWATYSPQLADPKNSQQLQKVQEKWLEELAKFVQTYSRVEDTPDALNHLGMGSEFAGRDEEAKRWYQQLYTNFPDHHMAAKAKGCVRRLDSVGQEMELTAPMLNAGGTFNIAYLKGKMVAVYYWASYASAAGDFARLKQLQTTYSAKGFELVCVSLDDTSADAIRAINTQNIPGVHIYQAPPQNSGGLNSPLATHYGIHGLPHMMLVGKDGKVINRSIQVSELEYELKKAL